MTLTSPFILWLPLCCLPLFNINAVRFPQGYCILDSAFFSPVIPLFSVGSPSSQDTSYTLQLSFRPVWTLFRPGRFSENSFHYDFSSLLSLFSLYSNLLRTFLEVGLPGKPPHWALAKATSVSYHGPTFLPIHPPPPPTPPPPPPPPLSTSLLMLGYASLKGCL